MLKRKGCSELRRGEGGNLKKKKGRGGKIRARDSVTREGGARGCRNRGFRKRL